MNTHSLRFVGAGIATAVLGLVLAGCSVPPSSAVRAPAPTTVTQTIISTKTVTAAPRTVTATVTTTASPATSEPDGGDAEGGDAPPTGLKVGGPGVTASNSDGGASVTVLSIKRIAKATGSFGDPPQNGNFLLIDVSYTCTTGTYDYNSFDWTVRDPAGRAYRLGDGAIYGGDQPELNSGTLAKGSKARGLVIIDAPKGPLSLEFTPGFSAPAIWDIPA